MKIASFRILIEPSLDPLDSALVRDALRVEITKIGGMEGMTIRLNFGRRTLD